MPRAFRSWTVLPHGPIQQLAENLWYVRGALPSLPIKRTMTIARLADGRLVLHNPIALASPELAELEALGVPSFLIVPNGWHRLDSHAFKLRYPAARVVCPSGARPRVEKAVRVDETYDEFRGDDTVSMTHLRGVRESEGVMKVESADGATLVFNDMLMNLRPFSGLVGMAYRALGSTGGAKVTPLIKTLLVRDKRLLGRHVAELAATEDLRRVVPGHGGILREGVAATLTSVAEAI